ncbi:hypothetical protein DFQ28_011243 [Apophysomyces sp. BC1034]|nr:hypothetical protein DFQ30_007051 [Apophysomyces sp. BC1015]KAG0194442.1 hypothetical protein DFQ28_011243 [Apophysomyces sp. BC1034]
MGFQREDRYEEEEEELDEFGRVKRRRQKFVHERRYDDVEEGEYDDEENEEDGRVSDSSASEDDYERSRLHRRRRSSGRRNYSDSDSEDGYRRRRRERRRSSSDHPRHDVEVKDPYAAAARYIDTEFFSTKIYVGDLVHVTQDDFERAFLRYGPIRQVKMVEGKEYAFVTYEDKESALAAIQNMHGALFGSRRIKVNRAKIPERNRVGFGNVPWTDEDGRLAQEEQKNYPARRERSPPISSDRPTASSRVLTSYDDL